MKTAMQELIDEISSSQQRFIDLAKTDKKFKKGVDAILTATTLIKMKAEKLLEKEKQQIIRAHCAGQDIEDTAGIPDALEYIGKTFKND